jgi:hypothetical protein
MIAIDHLLSLLGSQRDTCCRLLELVRAERDGLTAQRFDDLDAIVNEQIGLLARRRVYASRITHELQRLVAALSLDRPAPLAAIMARLPRAAARRVYAGYRDIAVLSFALRREGSEVCRLAQQAVTPTNFTCELLFRVQAKPVEAPEIRSRRRGGQRVTIQHCA